MPTVLQTVPINHSGTDPRARCLRLWRQGEALEAKLYQVWRTGRRQPNGRLYSWRTHARMRGQSHKSGEDKLPMMRRRMLFARASAILFSPLFAGCLASAQQETGSSAGTSGAGGQKQDLKKTAASLQAKDQALIDALNSKDAAKITKAKADLTAETNNAEDAVKSETGQTANQINSATSLIRTALLSNDAATLERAKTLLQQAQQ